MSGLMNENWASRLRNGDSVLCTIRRENGETADGVDKVFTVEHNALTARQIRVRWWGRDVYVPYDRLKQNEFCIVEVVQNMKGDFEKEAMDRLVARIPMDAVVIPMPSVISNTCGYQTITHKGFPISKRIFSDMIEYSLDYKLKNQQL